MPTKDYNFRQVQSGLSEGSILLVDVREEHEHRQERIPGAVHVPLDVVSEAFGLDPDHFESRFGFPKPHPDKQIVTYCVKGMRGAKAAAAIRAVGHAKVEVYGGSLQDWKEQGGPLERELPKVKTTWLSDFKHEYQEMVVPALMESNEIKEIKLREYLGKYVAILFYPADFTQLPRNEILELVDNHEKLRERGCQVFTCSTDSVQVHQAWQNTSVSDDADGLDRRTPFPMLGDKTLRLCRSFEVLDEDAGEALHALIILDPEGDVVYKETTPRDVMIHVDTIFRLLGEGERPAEALSNDQPVVNLEPKLFYAVEEEVEESQHHEADAVVVQAADQIEAITQKSSRSSSTVNSIKNLNNDAVELHQEPNTKGRESGALTLANAEDQAREEERISAVKEAEKEAAAKSKTVTRVPVTANKQSKKKKKGGGCCVIA